MSDAHLIHLLEALADLRRFWERPDRKRRFLAELGEPIELGVLRTLVAVHALADGAADATGDEPVEEVEEPGIGDVARALSVDGSTASRLVEQAVAAGHLDRQPGRRDRRRMRLELTATGAELVARSQELRRRWLADITAGWQPDEVEQLATLLQRFIGDADEVNR